MNIWVKLWCATPKNWHATDKRFDFSQSRLGKDWWRVYIVEVIVCMLGNTIPNEVVFFARYRIAKISHDANLSRNGNAKEMRKKCERSDTFLWKTFYNAKVQLRIENIIHTYPSWYLHMQICPHIIYMIINPMMMMIIIVIHCYQYSNYHEVS